MSFGHWLSQTFGYPWIERIEAAHLLPGDLLILNVAPGWKPEEMAHMREELLEVMPVDVRCVVISGGARIEIVRHIDPGTRPLATGPTT